MLIAFQGETGAYSEAAGAKFDPSATFLPCPAFEDVFAAVESGTAGCGVLPIENSIGGTIHRNYDLLVSHELTVAGEVELPVRHSLLALPGTTIDTLKQVYSHPQALAQCERFLRSLQGVDIVAIFTLVQRMLNVLANIFLAFVLIGALNVAAKERCTGSEVMDILEADLRINCIGILASERGVHAGC